MVARFASSLGVAILVAVAVCTAAVSSSRGAVTGIVFAANRVSVWYGEIYEIEPDGTRVDLSNSPAADVSPSVSPDGKWVAFASDRGGHVAVYAVGTDGTGLERLSPLLFTPESGQEVQAQIAWSADSRNVLAEIVHGNKGSASLYKGGLGGGWSEFAPSVNASALPAWSPDGRFISYATTFGTFQVLTAAGKKLWWAPGIQLSAWSHGDRLATEDSSDTIRVYSPDGRSLSSFQGQAFAWSPSGDVLASIDATQLELRRNGTGAAYLTVRISNATDGTSPASVGWLDATHVEVQTNGGWVEYDVTRKHFLPLPKQEMSYDSALGTGGAFAAQQEDANDVRLVMGTVGGSASAVARAPFCGDVTSFASLQFVTNSGALVYQSDCPNPSADLYAIDPDGSDLRQLTDTPTDELQPSLSTSGSTVAYVRQAVAEGCQGCPSTIWRIPSGGGKAQQLTYHSDNTAGRRFDDSPSWSPDAKTIVYTSSGFGQPERLFEIPAAGGTPRALDGTQGAGQPAWGPKSIAFVDDAVPHPEIQIYDPATGKVRVVLDDTGSGAQNRTVGPLAWSAGGRLAYIETDAAGRPSIYTLGSKQPAIDLASHLPRSTRVTGLAWSPDGTEFAFVATDADRVGEVYTIHTNGSRLTQATHGIGAVGSLSWR